MPHYEFLCHACQKTFSKILVLVDYEKGGICVSALREPQRRAARIGLLRHHA